MDGEGLLDSGGAHGGAQIMKVAQDYWQRVAVVIVVGGVQCLHKVAAFMAGAAVSSALSGTLELRRGTSGV